LSNFDEALARFHLGGLEYSGGLANHGPMGAEALERLGHQALIPAFLGLYAPRLSPIEAGRALSPDEISSARGDISRGADWVATFEARLADGDWRTVVARTVPGLLPGVFAGAGHGLLRTAHAIRALEAEDSELRRRELARGLAYWSARYQTLPGRPGQGSAPVGEVETFFEVWPCVGDPDARSGFFFEVVRRLDSFPAFAEAIERFARPEPNELSAFLSALCRLGASAYLAHPELRIAYVHALTIPSALRLVVPHLAEDDACLAGACVFQAMAALHSIFGEEQDVPEPDAEVARISNDWAEIRYHAACSLQEHSIKMVEACWREDQIAADAIFRRAAADAALQIDARGRAAAC